MHSTRILLTIAFILSPFQILVVRICTSSVDLRGQPDSALIHSIKKNVVPPARLINTEKRKKNHKTQHYYLLINFMLQSLQG
jgi:hypothetical protein